MEYDIPQYLGICSIVNCGKGATVKYGDIAYCPSCWEKWVKIRKLKNDNRK